MLQYACRLAVVGLLSTSTVAFAAEIAAFPGAEGSGATTPGGRGGQVYLVTSLADSGPGTLRDGCEAEGPRMVVINVDGTIELENPIQIAHPFLTLAGQAAPGDGACVKNYGLHITADDVVVRHMRFRGAHERAGILVESAQRVVIDHCSVSWSKGPTIAIAESQDGVTLQWNLCAETLYSPDSAEEIPGIGASIRAESGTFSIHHNYFAHHNTGIPYISGAREKPGPLLDLRGNVIYDWGESAGESGGSAVRYNFVGNIYKSGPSTLYESRSNGFRLRSMDSSLYFRDNELVDSDMVTVNNFLLWRMPDEFILRVHFEMIQPTDPFDADPITLDERATTLQRVLNEAGATKPRRDSVDARIITQYRLGGGRLIGVPEETGGWPEYAEGERPADVDADGMPDDWERTYGLSPQDATDHAFDIDGDGYTNIEEYLNSSLPGPVIQR